MRRASPSLLLGMLALTAPHCGGSTTAELGAPCASPSDCAPGLECVDRTCRPRAAGDAGTGGAAASTGGAGSGGAPDAGSDGGSLPCDGDAASCLCQSLATTCAPEESFEWLPLGSRGYRVCADAGGGCVVRHFQETEGGVAMFRCYVPHDLPCSGDPWSVIQSMTCSLVASCNLFLGSCPTDFLDCSLAPAAPSCTTVDPASFGVCSQFLGYGYDGAGCIGISGCGSGTQPGLFPTRDECWAACSRSCADVSLLRDALREEASSCSQDDDCMWIESGGPPYDHCSCMVTVNRNIDVGTWRSLNFAYACYDQGACCDAVAPNPVCIAGRCASSVN